MLIVSEQAKTEGILSLAEALALFDQLADMADIAWDYREDGCPAKTERACCRLIEAGLKPLKAWIFTEEGEERPHVGFADGEDWSWDRHIALALAVRMPDGEVRNMIFDPFLFDGPATIGEWANLVNVDPGRVEIQPYGTAPSGHTGDYDGDLDTAEPEVKILADREMSYYIRNSGWGLRQVFASAVRRFLDANSDTPPQGQTWKSSGGPLQPHAPVLACMH